jgi:hypothetical protein
MFPKIAKEQEAVEEIPKATASDLTYHWITDHTGPCLFIDELPGQRIRVNNFSANFCHGNIKYSTLYKDTLEFFRTKIIYEDDETIFDKVRLWELKDKDNPDPGYSFLTDPDNKDILKSGYKQFPAGINDHIVYDMADADCAAEPTYTLKDDFVVEYKANIQHFLSLLLILFYTRVDPPFCAGLLRTLHISNKAPHIPRSTIFTTPDLGSRSFRVTSGGGGLDVTFWDSEEVHQLLQLGQLSHELAAMLTIYLVDVLPFCRAHPALGFGHSNWFFTDGVPALPAKGDAKKGAEAGAGEGAEKPAVDEPWTFLKFEALLRRETKKRTGVEMGKNDFEKVYVGIMERRTRWRFHRGYFML